MGWQRLLRSRLFTQLFSWHRFVALLCCSLILAISAFAAPAIAAPVFATDSFTSATMSFPVASIHTYQEQPGQTTFRSKQSLRDRTDRSWQVILFKRYQGNDLQGLYLRLVGFPGIVSLNTDAPLSIETGSSLQWQAKPALDPQTPSLPDNAGQYDVSSMLEALEGDIPLQVNISLAGGSVAQLVVPPFAVSEWRDLAVQLPT